MKCKCRLTGLAVRKLKKFQQTGTPKNNKYQFLTGTIAYA